MRNHSNYIAFGRSRGANSNSKAPGTAAAAPPPGWTLASVCLSFHSLTVVPSNSAPLSSLPDGTYAAVAFSWTEAMSCTRSAWARRWCSRRAHLRFSCIDLSTITPSSSMRCGATSLRCGSRSARTGAVAAYIVLIAQPPSHVLCACTSSASLDEAPPAAAGYENAQ